MPQKCSPTVPRVARVLLHDDPLIVGKVTAVMTMTVMVALLLLQDCRRVLLEIVTIQDVESNTDGQSKSTECSRRNTGNKY